MSNPEIEKAKSVLNVKEVLIKANLTRIEDLLKKDVVDTHLARRTLQGVSDQFKSYQELYVDLIARLDSEPSLITGLTDLQARYDEVASKVDKLELERTSRSDDPIPNPLANSTLLERTKSSKLPTVNIPKFSGNHQEWLSFKNSFISMVHKRTDLDDVAKFIHLIGVLEGEPKRKISIYSFSAENYARAWDCLTQTYERTRILVSKYLDSIIDLAPVTMVTSTNLSRLVDDLKQNLNMLESLKVTLDDHLVLRIAERALPLQIRDKWEDAIKLDELPTLKEFYSFMERTIFKLCTAENNAVLDKSKTEKRTTDDSRPNKSRKTNEGVRTLVTTTSAVNIPCPCCEEKHMLYRCSQFKTLTIPKRKAFVRAKNLCYNCLGKHEGRCMLGHCKLCKENHHTMLHTDNPPRRTDANPPTPQPNPPNPNPPTA